jgi:hypothetical protein
MNNTDYWLKIQQITDISRWIDQAQAKCDIIDRLFHNLSITPKTILFPTFSPLVLLLEKNYVCYVVGDQSLKYAWHSNSEFIDSISELERPVDVTLALDEYFTYAADENEQRNLLVVLKAVTSGYLVTTLQDYKNSAPHKKSQVDASISQFNSDFIVIDQHVLDKNNRQSWQNYIYMIENHKDLTVLGPSVRRTMYFKQLAKYSSDLGGTEYVIQKNLLYRGFFKKNYEHIITVRF